MEFKTLEEKFLYDYARLEDENLELKEKIKELEEKLDTFRANVNSCARSDIIVQRLRDMVNKHGYCENTEENKND